MDHIRHFKTIRNLIFLALISINIGCDQVSKNLARTHLDYHDQVPVVGQHLLLTKVENSGAFLSLGDELPPLQKSLLLNLFPMLAMLAMCFYLFGQRHDYGTAFGVCCVIGGGIGNLFDRLMYGSVTDFLYMEVGFLRTGIFNFADVSITFGALLIIALRLLKKD